MIVLVDFLDTNERFGFYVGDNTNYTFEAIRGWAYKQARNLGYNPDTSTQIVRDNISKGTPFEYDERIFDHYVNKNSVEFWRTYYRKNFDIYRAPKYYTNFKLFKVH